MRSATNRIFFPALLEGIMPENKVNAIRCRMRAAATHGGRKACRVCGTAERSRFYGFPSGRVVFLIWLNPSMSGCFLLVACLLCCNNQKQHGNLYSAAEPAPFFGGRLHRIIVPMPRLIPFQAWGHISSCHGLQNIPRYLSHNLV